MRAILAMASALTIVAVCTGGLLGTAPFSNGHQPAGPRLIAVERLSDAMACEWAPDLSEVSDFFVPSLAASSQQASGAAAEEPARIPASQRKPVRVIQDPYP